MAKLTKANEAYVRENASKLGIVELCEHTGLSPAAIMKLVKQIESEPVVAVEAPPESQHETNVTTAKPTKSEALKRMSGKSKGVIVMTEEMSQKGEKPNRKKVTDTFAKSIHKIYTDE